MGNGVSPPPAPMEAAAPVAAAAAAAAVAPPAPTPVDRSGRIVLDGDAMGLREVTLSAARLRGLVPSLGSVAHPTLCVETKGGLTAPAVLAQEPHATVDVVLVIDVSGSMRPVINEVRETVMQVFTQLQPSDRLGLVTFSTYAKVLLELTTKDKVKNFDKICRGIRDESATNIEAGLRLGFSTLKLKPSEPVRPGLLLLLSDGHPNDGVRSAPELCNVARRCLQEARPKLTVHSLGFTADHDVSIMSSLPSVASGNYYYLATSGDIPAAVGDCLGSLAPAVCTELQLQVSSGSAEQDTVWTYAGCPGHWQTGPVLDLQRGAEARHDVLRAGERQVFLFVLPEEAVSTSVRLRWHGPSGAQDVALQLDWSHLSEVVELPQAALPASLGTLRVVSHVLRLQVGAALAGLALGDVIDGRYDPLHEAVMKCLESLHLVADDGDNHSGDAIFLEGMLQSLERDLGEALADKRSAGKGAGKGKAATTGTERKGVLLSFAQEHLAMRSASSLTRVRAAYASQKQIELRLRFLQSSGGVDAQEVKSKCALAEEGLTEEETSCRQTFEEGTKVIEEDGFVVPGGWRESVLGLGLFVHPRRLADRRKGQPPQIDLVGEYVSAEAYNRGVRALVQHVAVERAGEGAEEEAEEAAVEEQKVAASRQRINGWLPLYINSANWQLAKTFAPSAFSLLATQLNTAFQPMDALKVCARLMCCAVVGFVHPSADTGVPNHARAEATDRAIQMYCDVHRLFHEMAEMHPEIRATALREVQDFVRDPAKRTRRGTPDLGNLIPFLSIVDEVSWPDLARVFVPEMVRRAFARFTEPFSAEGCNSEAELIERFDALAPEHGLVILFFVIFNSLVARPCGPWSKPVPVGALGHEATNERLSGAEVRGMYDRHWGQLPPCRRRAVVEEVQRIRCLGSVTMVLRELLPHSFTDSDACELLLWGDHHGRSDKPIPLVPDVEQMSRCWTEEWRALSTSRQELERRVDQWLQEGIPPEECLRRMQEESSKVAAGLARERKRAQKAEDTKQKEKEGKTPDEEDRAKLSKTDLDIATGVAKSQKQPFDVRVIMWPEDEARSHSFVLHGVTYGTPERLTTGRDLRAKIAEATGFDARKMNVFVRGAVPEAVKTPKTEPVEDLRTALCNYVPLALWEVGSLGEACVEVRTKHRGGKKLGRPGNGWHKSQRQGTTHTMNIAAAIVRETTFAHITQYAMCVAYRQTAETLLGLVGLLAKDAVVVCVAGATAALRQDFLQAGATESSDAGSCLKFREHRLIFAEEAPLPEEGGAESEDTEEQEGEEENAGKKKGESGTEERIIEHQVQIPQEACGVTLAIACGSPLKEMASLGAVVRAMQAERSQEVTVYHLVSDERLALLNTKEDCDKLSACLSEDGVSLREELLLAGDQRVPPGARLDPDNSSCHCHVSQEALPALVRFRLRTASLGLVVRMREKLGLQITNIAYSVSQRLLTKATVQTSGAEEDWVAV